MDTCCLNPPQFFFLNRNILFPHCSKKDQSYVLDFDAIWIIQFKNLWKRRKISIFSWTGLILCGMEYEHKGVGSVEINFSSMKPEQNFPKFSRSFVFLHFVHFWLYIDLLKTNWRHCIRRKWRHVSRHFHSMKYLLLVLHRKLLPNQPFQCEIRIFWSGIFDVMMILPISVLYV